MQALTYLFEARAPGIIKTPASPQEGRRRVEVQEWPGTPVIKKLKKGQPQNRRILRQTCFGYTGSGRSYRTSCLGAVLLTLRLETCPGRRRWPAKLPKGSPRTASLWRRWARQSAKRRKSSCRDCSQCASRPPWRSPSCLRGCSRPCSGLTKLPPAATIC